MASFITDFITYMDTNLTGSWTAGTNLFYDNMPVADSTLSPAVPATVLAFWQTPTGAADKYQTTVFTCYLRFQSRAATRADALANWQTVFNFLSGKGSYATTNYQIFYSEAINPTPILLQDEKGNKIYESVFLFYGREK